MDTNSTNDFVAKKTRIFYDIPKTQLSEPAEDLVGHGVVWVIRHIRPRLVGGGGSGGALPATHVDGGQILRHLSHLL